MQNCLGKCFTVYMQCTALTGSYIVYGCTVIKGIDYYKSTGYIPPVPFYKNATYHFIMGASVGIWGPVYSVINTGSFLAKSVFDDI